MIEVLAGDQLELHACPADAVSFNRNATMPIVRKDFSYVNEWKRLWEPDLEAIGTNNGQTTDPTRVDPKVLQWIKEHCVHAPHFVKIINPNAAHGRPGLPSRNASTMNVPGPFVKQYFRSLERVITLEQDDGRKWKVAFASPGKYPVWNQGWDRFARDKNLKSGDVVVFVLVRDSCFHFTLFDAAGNINEKSASTVKKNNPTVYCKKEFLSRSSQDQPFVSNPETEQLPKTKKRLVADLLRAERLPNYKEFDGAATDTFPCHGHLGTTLAKEQTAVATCKVRKLQKFGEEFRNDNISERSTSTLNNDATVFCKKEFPSSSSQDQPFVSNPETEQLPKTKKRLVADLLRAERLPNYKEFDGAATDTFPCHGHLGTTLAKEQTAVATCKVRKLQKFGEEFRNDNISEKSTSTLNNDATVFCKKEFPSSSSQDQPFVSNLETEQLPTTTKGFVTDLLSAKPNDKERDGAATNTLPCHNHLESAPAKKQTALSPCKESKQRKFRENFGAPSQTLNLATEVEIIRVEGPLSRTTTIPPNAPNQATDSNKSSQVSPAPSPRLESLNPLAFTFKSRRRTVTPLERQRARESAMAFAGLTPGHCFMTVMSETHVYSDFHLVLPNWLGVALTLPASLTRLKLLDSEGHSWDMYSKKNTMNQFALHRKYWALFALHQFLEEGDVCVFAKTDESTIRTVVVHIFRVVPIAMADVSSVHAHYTTKRIK